MARGECQWRILLAVHVCAFLGLVVLVAAEMFLHRGFGTLAGWAGISAALFFLLASLADCRRTTSRQLLPYQDRLLSLSTVLTITNLLYFGVIQVRVSVAGCPVLVQIIPTGLFKTHRSPLIPPFATFPDRAMPPSTNPGTSCPV